MWTRDVVLAVTLVVLTYFAMSGSASADSDEALPTPPAPAGATVEWIARRMKLNGLPMTLRTFESPQSVQDVLSHYAHWWATHDAGSARTTTHSRRGEWEVLALASSQFLITVRAQPTRAGSHGEIAVSANPARFALSTATTFPHPSAARVTNLQQYDDPGAAAEHVSLETNRSPSIAASDFSRVLVREGWTIYRDQASQTFACGHVLEAQKGGELAQLTFTPAAHAGSTVIVIWRKG